LQSGDDRAVALFADLCSPPFADTATHFRIGLVASPAAIGESHDPCPAIGGIALQANDAHRLEVAQHVVGRLLAQLQTLRELARS